MESMDDKNKMDSKHVFYHFVHVFKGCLGGLLGMEIQIVTSIWIFRVDKLKGLYRPQRSCGKVMFLHLSVSHSVHRGRSVCGRHPQADTHLGRYPRGRHPRGRHPQADTPQAETPWADTPGRHSPGQTATAADSTHPTGMHSCWNLISMEVWVTSVARLLINWPVNVAYNFKISQDTYFHQKT